MNTVNVVTINMSEPAALGIIGIDPHSGLVNPAVQGFKIRRPILTENIWQSSCKATRWEEIDLLNKGLRYNIDVVQLYRVGWQGIVGLL